MQSRALFVSRDALDMRKGKKCSCEVESYEEREREKHKEDDEVKSDVDRLKMK